MPRGQRPSEDFLFKTIDKFSYKNILIFSIFAAVCTAHRILGILLPLSFIIFYSLSVLSKKENLINEVLKNHVLKELNLGENDIVLSRIEIGFRIILELSNNFRNRQKEENMLLKVEKILHKKIDERLELFTMEIKDQNKLRIKNSPQKNL